MERLRAGFAQCCWDKSGNILLFGTLPFDKQIPD